MTYCLSHNNWGSWNGFQLFIVPVYYWKTVEKHETDPQILWEWQYQMNKTQMHMHMHDLTTSSVILTIYTMTWKWGFQGNVYVHVPVEPSVNLVDDTYIHTCTANNGIHTRAYGIVYVHVYVYIYTHTHSLSHTHTHTLSHTYIHTLSLTLCLSLSHTHSLTLSRTHSLSHTQAWSDAPSRNTWSNSSATCPKKSRHHHKA